jgi:hypothetical protein
MRKRERPKERRKKARLRENDRREKAEAARERDRETRKRNRIEGQVGSDTIKMETWEEGGGWDGEEGVFKTRGRDRSKGLNGVGPVGRRTCPGDLLVLAVGTFGSWKSRLMKQERSRERRRKRRTSEKMSISAGIESAHARVSCD